MEILDEMIHIQNHLTTATKWIDCQIKKKVSKTPIKLRKLFKKKTKKELRI